MLAAILLMIGVTVCGEEGRRGQFDLCAGHS